MKKVVTIDAIAAQIPARRLCDRPPTIGFIRVSLSRSQAF
jgi:hypothetical protein